MSDYDDLQKLHYITAETPVGALYDQILLFGDSITQFADDQSRGFAFVPALKNAYDRKVEVNKQGLSGYNTALALKVVEHVMPPTSWTTVRIMTLFFGANDSCYPLEDPKWNQCVPLQEFRQNLIKIIEHPSVKAHSPKIIMITPPPIDERQQFFIDQDKGFQQPRRSAENTKHYADMVRTVANEKNLPVLDMWTRCMEYAGWQPGDPLPGRRDIEQNERLLELFVDGLHLSPKGYELLYREFWEILKQDLPDLTPDKFLVALPEWNDFPDTVKVLPRHERWIGGGKGVK